MSLENFGKFLISGKKGEKDEPLSYRHGVLKVPKKVELQERRLIWNLTENFVTKEAAQDLIHIFANLAFVESQGILKFAQTWGTLGMCKHGLPASHDAYLASAVENRLVCKPRGDEPVEVWHRLARVVRAMLKLSLSLKEDRQGNADDWLVLLEGNEAGDLPKDIAGGRLLLEEAVNLWLDLGGVRPRLRWEKEGVLLEPPFYYGLFGTLAIQLMSAVVGSESLLICSACGTCGSVKKLATMRLRRPKAGTRFYCDDCQSEGAPQRHASKAYRQRKGAKK